MFIVSRLLLRLIFRGPHRKRARGHGYSAAYIAEFSRVRPAILRRDHYKCTRCGSGKRLHVHHKTWRSRGGTNAPSNLTTLCAKCHGRVHGRKF